MKYWKPSFKLSLFSNLVLLFLHEEKNSCGNSSYGLPAEFINSYCDCAEHNIPIDFSALIINLLYHFVIWYSILYLWEDAKETWAMIYGKRNMKGL